MGLVVAQALYLGAQGVIERRGIGEARCLAQQIPGALLQVSRALAEGFGRVPQPRAGGLVERWEADGLQVVLRRNITSYVHILHRFLAERRGIGCHGLVRVRSRGYESKRKTTAPHPPET